MVGSAQISRNHLRLGALPLCFFLALASASYAQRDAARLHESPLVQWKLSDAAAVMLLTEEQLLSELALKKVSEIDQTLQPNEFEEALRSLAASVRSLQPVDLNLSNEEARRIGFKPKALAASSRLWAFNTIGVRPQPNGKLSISVCWLNPTFSNRAGRRLTEAAVKATWQEYGNVAFSFSSCSSDSESAIRIAIADARPYSEIGTESLKVPNQSMVLNFSFEHPEMVGCKPRRTECIWSLAVHEFGHALGYLHEQDRLDTPAWCSRKHPRLKIPASLKPKRISTQWDHASVMDYCFDIYSRRAQLSDCDIGALYRLYGRPLNAKYQPKCPIQ